MIIALYILSSIPMACQKNTREIITEENKIPVYINSSSRIQTRVADGIFEGTDEIGLYLLKQPNKITDERHVDNMRFKLKQSNWIPDKIIYYPSTNDLCDFIAYYPYRESAFAENSSLISCKTALDQSEIGNYVDSDFLLAEKNSVVPSTEAVSLIFKHKLAEICIDIKPGTGFNTIEELAATNPTVSIKGISIRGDYNIDNKTFTNLSDISDIIPTGQFKIDGDKLTGKHAIVIPQEITGDKIFIEVKAGGKNYNFTFGEKHVIAAATKETCTLTIKRASPQSNIKTEISDWENNTSIEGDLNEEEKDEPNTPSTNDFFCISLPDFSQSSVYKVMNGEVQIAEICKEYLQANGVDNLAIVIYPKNNGTINLTKGYVAQLFDRASGNIITESIHGGIASWNESTNILTYQIGTRVADSAIYMDEEGNFSSTSVTSASSTGITPDIIADARDNKSYSITKIATQYWMGENLAAETFNNGAPITKAQSESDWSKAISNSVAAYSVNNSNYYYNFAAASEKIAPEGWKVPSYDDWMKLKAYIKNNTSLITSWEGSNNLTGLSIIESGFRDKDGKYSTTPNTSYFWNTQSGITIYSSIITDSSQKQGNSIRLIKK